MQVIPVPGLLCYVFLLSAFCHMDGDLPGKRFFRDADTELFLAFFQDAGQLVQIRGVLFLYGGSEFRVKLLGELDFLIADFVRTSGLFSTYINDE